jgi:FkbM family methyltransferase
MATSLTRRLMELAWRLVPNRRRVLVSLAQLPPRWKGPLLERIARVGLDVAGYERTDELPTNFATKSPPVLIPIHVGRVYFFGNPAKSFNEAPTIRLCRGLVADACGFVDIGAYVGLYLWALLDLFEANRPGYFFEPNPDFFRVLQRNASRLTKHLQGFAAAINDHDGITPFWLDVDDSSSSTVVTNPCADRRYRRMQVPCMRFDSFAQNVGLKDAVVKADVEGGEARLLEGLAASGEAMRDFVCEVLEPMFQAGFVSEAAERLDAQAYLIRDGLLSHWTSVTSWHGTERNWLFTRVLTSFLNRSQVGMGSV